MQFNAFLKELRAPIRVLNITPFSLIIYYCLDTQTSVSGVDYRVSVVIWLGIMNWKAVKQELSWL